MDDADDSESWAAAAAARPELAAHQIVRLKFPRWNPTWRDLLPPPSADWGSRRKRSRTGDVPTRIRVRHPAAASPATPLDFGSGSASVSGSDEPSCSQEKRRRRTADDDVSGSGGPVTKAGGIQRLPLSFRIPAARDRKRSGRKKTICELQEEEKKLVEQKKILQKEVESGRKACEALQAENKRLRSRQSSLQLAAIASDTVSSAPSSGAPRFLLPDLNEPLSDNSD